MKILSLVLLTLLLASPSGADLLIDIGGRTVNVHEPPSYDPGVPTPVVMLLHGYTSSGAVQESYMQFEPLADSEGFLYLHPDGTLDCTNEAFWNGTDACCDLCGSGVDDVGFLGAVLDAVEANFNVDPNRVYLIGHSNGGFMSYRMACEHADRIAAIASLAGATWFDPNDCTPSGPVHTLQIHGTIDGTILYAGGLIAAVDYPGAVATTETWANYNACSLVPDTSPPPLDLDSSLSGNETTVARYATGCDDGGSSELWTINGGGHVPALSSSFNDEVVDWLLAHPKQAITLVPATNPVLLAACLVGAALSAGAVVRRARAQDPGETSRSASTS